MTSTAGSLTSVFSGRSLSSRVSGTDFATKVVVFVVSGLLMIYILLPVFWMLKSSFQSSFDIRQLPPQWIPRAPSFTAYHDAGVLIPIWRYLFNSIVVSGVASVLATAMAATAAYVLSRFRFPGAIPILTIILVTQLIPPITRVFPIYAIIQDLNLLNTYTGVIVAYIGFSLPFAVLLLRGYFQSSCPPELAEAAMVDGCGYFGAFWRVVLPVSMPGIAAVGIFTFLNAWNDFLWASLLVSSGEMKTIQVGIGDFASEGGGIGEVNAFMAACVMATIPALLIFVFMQRWLVSGLTAGSVKN